MRLLFRLRDGDLWPRSEWIPISQIGVTSLMLQCKCGTELDQAVVQNIKQQMTKALKYVSA